MLDDYAAWLVETAQSIGLTCAGEQLPWTEIRAWESGSGVDLTPWEGETMRALSGAFLEQVRAGDAKPADRKPAPFATKLGLARATREHTARRLQVMRDRLASRRAD